MRHLVGANLVLGWELWILQLLGLTVAALELLVVFEMAFYPMRLILVGLLLLGLLRVSAPMHTPPPRAAFAPHLLLKWSYGNLVPRPPPKA